MYNLFTRTRLLDLTQITSNKSAYLAIVCRQRNLHNSLLITSIALSASLKLLFTLLYIYFNVFYYKCKMFIVGNVPAGSITVTNNISVAVQALSIAYTFFYCITNRLVIITKGHKSNCE